MLSVLFLKYVYFREFLGCNQCNKKIKEGGQMNIGLMLLITFLFLIAIGVPVSIAMGISVFTTLLYCGYKIETLPLLIQNGASNISLVAIPYFIFAGNLMNASRLTEKIFDLANALVGSMQNGLAQVNVLASMIFAGISGTMSSDAAGLGLIEIDAMVKRGYEKPFSVAITLASSVLGPIIPPSVSFIVFAMLAQVSIMKLFIAGIVPGILIGIIFMVINYLLARQGKIIIPEPEKFDFKILLKTFKDGFFALLAPALLLLGILSGVTTPTEVGVAAIFYTIVIGVLSKELTWKKFIEAGAATVCSTSIIMYLIGMGNAMGWIVTIEQLPQQATALLFSITQNKYMMLILINVILLILGMFIDGTTIKLIMIPLLLPIIDSFGINRIQFGVWSTLNILIGSTTPPVGVCLFIMCSITDLKMTQVVKAMIPYYIPLLIALLLVTFIPFLTLWLPSII
jgi:tripartite ATP-independent transporter DctM subunit